MRLHFPYVLLEVAQAMLQALERVPHAALDRVGRHPNDLRDLFESKALYLTHEKDFPLLLGKSFHCLCDSCLKGPSHRQAVRWRPRVGHPLAHGIQRCMPAKNHLPLMVDATVPSDGVQPCRELGIPSELVAALDDPHPDILVELFRPATIAYGPQNEVEERPSVSIEQQLESLLFARPVGAK